ncbi:MULTISPECIES: SdpA family antimicrobial peptide system protein [Chryseobacterium]|uniref:SdpA family antimicrobial peptide system protein n=1 Tax=Chryseobacterium TaxID=59732 RepID=UPI00048980DA|nr:MULTISPECIES: SdpA family antimicrobial peptide system protein [Chryseobacterium]ASE63002.1 SdpA family antimicrobial peptide system protein [Chryseobacterium indologenes]VFA42546.1 antimicrobial peptide system protein, SdpA family [Chryseobacterium indologenes]
MKKTKFYYFSTLFVWIIGFFVVFFSAFKEQVVVSYNCQQFVSLILPQGWGFFTKNPRDPLLEVYKVERNGTIIKVTLHNLSFNNDLGLSRRARMIGYESAQITNSIPANYWKKDIYSNLNRLSKNNIYLYNTKAKSKHFNDGLYLFITYKTVPFAWAKQHQEGNNPINYTFVNIYNDK